VAGDSDTSRALIQSKTAGTILICKVGDMAGAAIVESIESDRVVVRHAGRRKVLPIQSGAVSPSKGRSGRASSEHGISGRRTSAEQLLRIALLGYVEQVFHKAKIEPYVRNGRTRVEDRGLEDTALAGLFGLKNAMSCKRQRADSHK